MLKDPYLIERFIIKYGILQKLNNNEDEAFKCYKYLMDQYPNSFVSDEQQANLHTGGL